MENIKISNLTKRKRLLLLTILGFAISIIYSCKKDNNDGSINKNIQSMIQHFYKLKPGMKVHIQ